MRFQRLPSATHTSSTGRAAALSNDEAAATPARKPASAGSPAASRNFAATAARKAATVVNRHMPYAWPTDPCSTMATFSPMSNAATNEAAMRQRETGSLV